MIRHQILFALALVAIPISGQESETDQQIRTLAALDPIKTKRFFLEMKQAISTDDKSKIARMVRYPIYVTHGKRSLKVKSVREFERRYTEIITPLVKQAVLVQDYEELFVKNYGVAVGNGVIWFTASQGKYLQFDQFRVFAINQPVSAP